MAVLTRWPGLRALHGTSHDDSWDHHYEWLEMHGDFPFRGDFEHPGWSPARVEPPVRNSENVRELYAFVGDLDGTCSVSEALATWGAYPGGLIHTTRRHTTECPRLRVIIPLSRPVSPAEYAVIWARMQSVSGGKLDPATKDPARFWYLPGSAVGAEFHAWRTGR